MYEQADKVLSRLKKKLKKEIRYIEIQSFSDLTPDIVNKQTRGMVERLLEDNETGYIFIAKDARKKATAQLEKEGYGRIAKFDELNTMDSTLRSYNEVTGYLYYHETKRKRARIAEEINTARYYGNRVFLLAALARFAKLWFLQTQEYMISIVDSITMKTYEAAGVEYARWIAKKDKKTCEICKKRDGMVYPIKKFPSKPHYNCRCTRRPLPLGYKPTDDELGDD